jgi:CCR4-NOT transcription complex subunit 2
MGMQYNLQGGMPGRRCAAACGGAARVTVCPRGARALKMRAHEGSVALARARVRTRSRAPRRAAVSRACSGGMGLPSGAPPTQQRFAGLGVQSALQQLSHAGLQGALVGRAALGLPGGQGPPQLSHAGGPAGFGMAAPGQGVSGLGGAAAAAAAAAARSNLVSSLGMPPGALGGGAGGVPPRPGLDRAASSGVLGLGPLQGGGSGGAGAPLSRAPSAGAAGALGAAAAAASRAAGFSPAGARAGPGGMLAPPHPHSGGGAAAAAAGSDLLALINKGVAAQQQGPPGSLLSGFMSGAGDGSGLDGGGMPFDLSDFPHLGGSRPSSGSGLGLGLGMSALGLSMGMEGLDLYGKPLPEFSIQNEDFPALPGAPPNSKQQGMGLMHKDGQAHGADGMGTMGGGMGTMGVGGMGMGLGMPHGARDVMRHLLGADADGGMGGVFGRGGGDDAYEAAMSASYGAQGGYAPQQAAAAAQHALSLAQQQQAQQQQAQQQQAAAAAAAARAGGARPTGIMPGGGGASAAPPAPGAKPSSSGAPGGGAGAVPASERYGLLGLLSAIRMSDVDLSTLALGTDLTTLGLNLNSAEALHKTFASPWADAPCRAEPELATPAAYLQQPPWLAPGLLSRFSPESLFYVFYSSPGDDAQLAAAEELAARGWHWHKELKAWLQRAPGAPPPVKGERGERGAFVFFDAGAWERVRKDNFALDYAALDETPRPRAPTPAQQQAAAAQQAAQQAAAAAQAAGAPQQPQQQQQQQQGGGGKGGPM